MTSLLILALVVLVVQVILFFTIRSKKQKLEFPSELEKKYRIRTRSDAWRLLNDPELPEAEKSKIEDLYRSMG